MDQTADHVEPEVCPSVSASATDDIAPMAHVLPLPDSTLQNMEYTESELNSYVSCFWPFILAFADD